MTCAAAAEAFADVQQFPPEAASPIIRGTPPQGPPAAQRDGVPVHAGGDDIVDGGGAAAAVVHTCWDLPPPALLQHFPPPAPILAAAWSAPASVRQAPQQIQVVVSAFRPYGAAPPPLVESAGAVHAPTSQFLHAQLDYSCTFTIILVTVSFALCSSAATRPARWTG